MTTQEILLTVLTVSIVILILTVLAVLTVVLQILRKIKTVTTELQEMTARGTMAAERVAPLGFAAISFAYGFGQAINKLRKKG